MPCGTRSLIFAFRLRTQYVRLQDSKFNVIFIQHMRMRLETVMYLYRAAKHVHALLLHLKFGTCCCGSRDQTPPPGHNVFRAIRPSPRESGLHLPDGGVRSGNGVGALGVARSVALSPKQSGVAPRIPAPFPAPACMRTRYTLEA